MDLLLSPDAWVAFLTLLVLEVVLGVDNVIFISILSGKLPEEQRDRARITGLSLALIMRVALLFSLSWVIGLTAPLFSAFGMEISGRDLILLLGGAFLVAKAVSEIHERLEGEEAHPDSATAATASFAGVIAQILVLDIVFSLDSVITAVGMVSELAIMVAAVVVAVGIMLVASKWISDFVNKHPSVKMLALAFLVLIGASLIGEGLDFHIPKGYVYGPIAFAILVEALNLRYQAVQARRRHVPEAEPVHLRPAYLKDEETRPTTEPDTEPATESGTSAAKTAEGADNARP
jgi:predicted tellurium resistance membrane protein TerC